MYKAKEPKLLWILLFLTTLLYALFLEGQYLVVFVLVSVVLVIIMFSHYTFTIDETTLTMRYHVAGIQIFKRSIQAESIKKILFITSSRQTIALVQLHKGLRLKLHRFQPSDYIQELQEFAEEHDVATEETSFIKQRK
ncbi:hypothetical protein [Alkalicoccobacillus murimartini]|uniref:PH domain-containing protein n=1 Tax=Alkalicoccobacillus murimartini TaxID=171685 RepID=A0ABT9YFE5_9BACI|nr:hypothetical protein [Alkalicoccobacillus murimartini]MDQ0206572.1 hypothetical protein [Alkalicoccobacillus murimartini]